MLALGLYTRLSATAYLDDAIDARYRQQYAMVGMFTTPVCTQQSVDIVSPGPALNCTLGLHCTKLATRAAFYVAPR